MTRSRAVRAAVACAAASAVVLSAAAAAVAAPTEAGGTPRAAAAPAQAASPAGEAAPGRGASGEGQRARPRATVDQGGAPRREPRADGVIVRFRPGASGAAVAAAVGAARARERGRLGFIGARVLAVPAGESPAGLAARLSKDPAVDYAVPNYVRTASAVPNDTYWTRLWGLHNTGQTVSSRTGVADVDVDAPEAWDVASPSPDALVAVIDTGVDTSHPDLAGVTVPGWDFVNGDATVYDRVDGDEHGTHVAGTIAALAGNGRGIAGVAPGVEILPLKVLGPDGGTDADIIAALQMARDRGARIVNMSLGGPGYSQALSDAIAASGALVVAAAGNDGVNLDDPANRTYPASYDLPNIVGVAAVDNAGRLASFSNYGASGADVAAPGVAVLSTVPTLPEDGAVVLSGDGRAATLGFGLEDVAGATARRNLVSRVLASRGITSTTPVLLVQDDSADSYGVDTSGFWLTALRELGFGNVAHTAVPTKGSGPTAAQMQGRAVVWITGDSFGASTEMDPTVTQNVPTLTTADVNSITAFLDGGGRLVLSGADAIYAREANPLVTTRLGVRFLAEESTRTQTAGRGTWAGFTVPVTGADNVYREPNPFRDALAPASGAEAPLVYPAASDTYAYENGTSMAAPHAAGVAALALSRWPALTGRQLAERLLDSVTPLAAAATKTSTGGLVNATVAVTGTGSPLPQDTTAPKPVSELTVRSGWTRADLTWRNPDTLDLAGVTARVAAGTAAPGPTSGYAVYSGPGTSAARTGLVEGRTYTFAVYARDEVPNHSPAAKVTVHGSAVAGRVSATAVTFGSPVTHTATLTRAATKAALGGRTLVLYQRRPGTSAFSAVCTTRTSSTGQSSCAVKPTAHTEYRWGFPGSGADGSARTPVRTVQVAPKVTAAASRSTVARGSTFTVTGTVSPSHAGQRVELQRLGGSTWRTVATAALTSSSTYSFAVRPSAAGTQTLRVRKAADADHFTTASPTVTVRVT